MFFAVLSAWADAASLSDVVDMSALHVAPCRSELYKMQRVATHASIMTSALVGWGYGMPLPIIKICSP